MAGGLGKQACVYNSETEGGGAGWARNGIVVDGAEDGGRHQGEGEGREGKRIRAPGVLGDIMPCYIE
jgi:hypothetical protein